MSKINETEKAKLWARDSILATISVIIPSGIVIMEKNPPYGMALVLVGVGLIALRTWLKKK